MVKNNHKIFLIVFFIFGTLFLQNVEAQKNPTTRIEVTLENLEEELKKEEKINETPKTEERIKTEEEINFLEEIKASALFTIIIIGFLFVINPILFTYSIYLLLKNKKQENNLFFPTILLIISCILFFTPFIFFKN